MLSCMLIIRRGAYQERGRLACRPCLFSGAYQERGRSYGRYDHIRDPNRRAARANCLIWSLSHPTDVDLSRLPCRLPLCATREPSALLS